MSSTSPEIQQHTFTTFKEFEEHFEYKGDRLYSMIFERNKDKIKVSKEKFAIRNLQKIFNATFLISPKIGFHAMSLRDLSAETGLSMGGLYSSISSKDAIAIIVKDVVAFICEDIVEESREQEDPMEALRVLVKGYLYASTIMQAWFNFLYFETKCLPQIDQEESKNLELAQVGELDKLISKLSPDLQACHKSGFVATMALSMIQERYLKPWKYHNAEQTVDEYADSCLQLIYRAACLEEVSPCKTAIAEV
ncbi:hypothetical protein OO007_00125 [Cocleimonas sp. KMM 6892]|uniref:TetR/AcrR family transcriptional regulator n=1 Tax=unclassified Cocleimonas TaxID=2639732 RepID=UPI002DBF815B|nr:MULTISPECIES: hypothetical protein [unclassified Cocleimonas]MEB8430618.1 hypothetical protein [Cocleimonas sp. KMM 6892]MEC4716931.1 hypothetical protein [Cocleimonas sp. KMM 6895]MEC4743943.1 hypothetical protein [Cocleimonas sp. KMM 6896]